MMEAYAKEIGFQKETIDKEVMFIYEGISLDTKENGIVENVLRDKNLLNF